MISWLKTKIINDNDKSAFQNIINKVVPNMQIEK